jgi:DNA ligase (NAD+)
MSAALSSHRLLMLASVLILIGIMLGTKGVTSWVIKAATSRRITSSAERKCIHHLHSIIPTSTTTRRSRIPVRRFSTINSINQEQDAISSELAELDAQIQHHNYLYYVTSNPILSDDEFDALIQKERQLKAQHPQLWSERTVGAAVPEQNTRQHSVPMLSLDNCFSQEELHQWLEKLYRAIIGLDTTAATTNTTPTTPVLLILSEPKLDGVSLNLHFTKTNEQHYQLTWASTRGDGRQGTDVTAAVLEMDIPTTFAYKGSTGDTLDVRGELLLPKTVSNARNAASGLLLRKESNSDLRREFTFYAYDLCGEAAVVDDIMTGQELRETLQTMGFAVPYPVASTALHLSTNQTTDISELLNYHSNLLQQRETFPHDMDGAVYKVGDMALRTTLGTTTRAPRWALAHKFPALTVMAPLLGMSVQVGRTGALTPVALLQPVDINGVSVQRATLHNYGCVQTLFEGRTQVPVGTWVMVRRAGDVIPQVIRTVDLAVATTSSNSDMISLEAPTHCPACNSPVIRGEDEAVLRCGGPPLQCPPRAIAALAHSFSRDALDIKGLSEKKLEQLRNESILTRPSDLFQLNDTVMATIAELPGWGPKSAKNLNDTAKQVANNGVTLGRFIYSLGIRFAGQQSSDLVAAQYGTVEAFFQDKDDNYSRLLAVKGIGPALLSSLQTFAKDEVMFQEARALASVLLVRPVEMVAVRPVVDLPWNGWVVVFTGALPDMSRADAQKLAKEVLGATSTPSTVSKNTNLVVAGDKGGKKLKQAVELGVKVMDDTEFVKLIAEYR